MNVGMRVGGFFFEGRREEMKKEAQMQYGWSEGMREAMLQWSAISSGVVWFLLSENNHTTSTSSLIPLLCTPVTATLQNPSVRCTSAE